MFHLKNYRSKMLEMIQIQKGIQKQDPKLTFTLHTMQLKADKTI